MLQDAGRKPVLPESISRYRRRPSLPVTSGPPLGEYGADRAASHPSSRRNIAKRCETNQELRRQPALAARPPGGSGLGPVYQRHPVVGFLVDCKSVRRRATLQSYRRPTVERATILAQASTLGGILHARERPKRSLTSDWISSGSVPHRPSRNRGATAAPAPATPGRHRSRARPGRRRGRRSRALRWPGCGRDRSQGTAKGWRVKAHQLRTAIPVARIDIAWGTVNRDRAKVVRVLGLTLLKALNTRERPGEGLGNASLIFCSITPAEWHPSAGSTSRRGRPEVVRFTRAPFLPWRTSAPGHPAQEIPEGKACLIEELEGFPTRSTQHPCVAHRVDLLGQCQHRSVNALGPTSFRSLLVSLIRYFVERGANVLRHLPRAGITPVHDQLGMMLAKPLLPTACPRRPWDRLRAGPAAVGSRFVGDQIVDLSAQFLHRLGDIPCWESQGVVQRERGAWRRRSIQSPGLPSRRGRVPRQRLTVLHWISGQCCSSHGRVARVATASRWTR